MNLNPDAPIPEFLLEFRRVHMDRMMERPMRLPPIRFYGPMRRIQPVAVIVTPEIVDRRAFVTPDKPKRLKFDE